jgi:hypothetical protein
MKVDATLIDHIHRFIFGPKKGDVYIEKDTRDRYDNPFKTRSKLTLVEIIDTKRNWIQFRYLNTDAIGVISEWQINSFEFAFKLQQKEKYV